MASEFLCERLDHLGEGPWWRTGREEFRAEGCCWWWWYACWSKMSSVVKQEDWIKSLRKPIPKNAQTTAQLHSSHMLVK